MGKTFGLTVEGTDTILWIKLLLHRKFHIRRVFDPSLHCLEKFETLQDEHTFYSIQETLKDDYTLFYYNIQNGGTLMWRKIEFVLSISHIAGIVCPLDARPTATIRELKGDIQDWCGMPSAQQRLTFANMELQDDRTLLDYGIQHMSALYLRCVVPIF